MYVSIRIKGHLDPSWQEYDQLRDTYLQPQWQTFSVLRWLETSYLLVSDTGR